MLLERNDVHPNRLDEGPFTPLSLAAKSGYGGMVVGEILQPNDIHPGTADEESRIPHFLAADNANEGAAGIVMDTIRS